MINWNLNWNPLRSLRKRPKEISVKPPRTRVNLTRSYSPFQLFVLTYLYTTEFEQDKLRESDYNLRVKMWVDDFIYVTPKEFLPASTDQVQEELMDLRREFLLTGTAHQWYLSHEEGQFFVKKYLDQLVSNIQDRKQYQRVIDSIQASKEVKTYFSGLWDKLKDESQDQVVKELLSVSRILTPLVIVSLTGHPWPPPSG